MTPEEFVHVVELVVRDAAIDDTLEVLAHPPGRRPREFLLEQSRWYLSLGENDRKMLTQVVTRAVNSAVFGFFCVLDGVRAIEDGPAKGELVLSYVKDGVQILNPPEGEMLHEIFNAE